MASVVDAENDYFAEVSIDSVEHPVGAAATMRAECFRIHDRRHARIGQLQAVVDAWVVEYNTRRPHQALGRRRIPH